MDNADNIEYIKSWVVVNENTKCVSNDKNNDNNNIQEQIEELNKTDFVSHKSEVDTESDGISVISESDKSSDDIIKSFEIVKEDTITTSELAKQISDIQMKMIDTKKHDKYYYFICHWLIMLSLLLLGIILAQTFNETMSDINENCPIEIDLLNVKLSDDANLLNVANSGREDNSEDAKEKSSNEPHNYNTHVRGTKQTFQKEKLTNKKNYKVSDNGRSNEIFKDKLEHDKHTKYKNRYQSVDTNLYENKIIKDKEQHTDETRFKSMKNNYQYNVIMEKEKQLELQEEHLKRKEKFLLNKEYKLLQKEIELNKLMANQKDYLNMKNDNNNEQMGTERKFKKKSKDVENSHFRKDKHKNKDNQKKYDKIHMNNKEKFNKTTPGEWFNKRHINREYLRKSDTNTVWLLHDLRDKKIKNKARWYFQWMEDREKARFKKVFKQRTY